MVWGPTIVSLQGRVGWTVAEEREGKSNGPGGICSSCSSCFSSSWPFAGAAPTRSTLTAINIAYPATRPFHAHCQPCYRCWYVFHSLDHALPPIHFQVGSLPQHEENKFSSTQIHARWSSLLHQPHCHNHHTFPDRSFPETVQEEALPMASNFASMNFTAGWGHTSLLWAAGLS